MSFERKICSALLLQSAVVLNKNKVALKSYICEDSGPVEVV